MKWDRCVIDTSVYVSLVLKNNLDLLVNWRSDYKIEMYGCAELYAEIATVLNRRKIKPHLGQPIKNYLAFIKATTIETAVDLRFDRAPDLKDNYLFDLAYTAKVHYIITHDKPLLNLKQVNKIKIVSLSDWKKVISK